MKSDNSSSHRAARGKRRVAGAAIAAAVTTALVAAVPGNAVAASKQPDLADRVTALRQLLAERSPSVEGTAPWVDRALTPGPKLAQWNKWKNG
jgi:hypothetical protein